MSKVSEMIAILVLLCLAQRHDVDAAIRSFERSHDFQGKQIMFDAYSFKEGNLVFALCDGSAKQKNCTVTQEQYPDGKSPRTCNISIESYGEEANLTNKIYAVTMGPNHAILFWGEDGPMQVFKLFTIDMNTCEMGGFAQVDPSMSLYDQLSSGHKILTYNDTFEMFIKLDNETESVMTYNSRGHVLKGPNELLKNGKKPVRFISPIATHSPAKGYVYYKYTNYTSILTIVKPDGSEKSVTSHRNYVLNIALSANSGTITSCILNRDSSMECEQYDENGNMIFNVAFDDDDFKKMSPAALHNSPHGGFLLMMVDYDISETDSSDYIDRILDYVVIRVDREGRKVGSIHLKDFIEEHKTVKETGTAHIWENGDEEFCAALIGYELDRTNPEPKPVDFRVLVNCFMENDFKA